jgi:hypothetical protein
MFLTRSDDFSRYCHLKRLKSSLQTQNVFLKNYIEGLALTIPEFILS